MVNKYELSDSKENDIQPTKTRNGSDTLLKKRFELPRSGEMRGKLKELQHTTNEIKKDKPAVVCLLLYGSFTKGYATEKSDFDGFLLIDEDIVNEELANQDDSNFAEQLEAILPHRSLPKESGNPKLPTKEDLRKMEIRSKAMNIFFNFINGLKEKGFSDKQLEHLRPEIVTEKSIIESMRKDPKSIAHLFMMAVGGKEISRYREIIFKELEMLENEQLAECRWQDIMRHLHTAERKVNGDLAETWSLYPKTLKEARKYFLKK